ncbi:MAG: hypothetical protein HYT76_08050 [Deltaproteobacteria bacterium]|nr:hypothetical protein [Deltaproteobacteria bacterium]
MADPATPPSRISVALARFDVDPDETLPSGGPPEEVIIIPDGPLECPNYVYLRADEQEDESVSPTGLRTLTLATKAPAIRLMGTTTNVGLAKEHLTRVARDRIPLQCRTAEFVKGSIELGDAIDTGSVSELVKALARERRLEAWDRLMRMVAIATGNHDMVMPNGVTDSGEFYTGFNAVGTLMGADGPGESWRSEIVREEVGSEENMGNKLKFLKMIQKHLGLPWQPVLLQDADDTVYHVAGEPQTYQWSDEKATVENFWKSYDNGEFWQATIKFKPDKKLHPDQQYFGISAVKLDENTYSILMDTTDLLEDSRKKGLLHGHLSYVQVRMIQGLMRHLKTLNPKAKFVLNSHFPLDDLDGTIYQVFSSNNHLEEILNDESVVAVIVAHTHEWDMKDLNSGKLRDKLKINRRTPLLQYNVTSIIDWPVGAAQMTVQSDPEYLTLTLHRIDFTDTLPSMDADAQKKFDDIDPELLSFATAWHDMTDARFKVLGHPRAKLGEQLFVAGDIHVGLVPEPGKFYYSLMTHDAIPVDVVRGMLTMRHEQDIFALELNTVTVQDPSGNSTPLRPAATVVDEESKKYLQHLRAYYTNSLIAHRSRDKKKASEARSAIRAHQKAIDESTRTLLHAYQEVMQQLEIEMLPLDDKKKAKKTSDAENSRLNYLKNLHDIARISVERAVAAKNWFLLFNIKLAQGQKEDDLATMNNFRSLDYWRDMDRFIQNLPYNRWGTNEVSPATAYRLHIHERSAERRANYLGDKPKRNVPPVVTIKVNLTTNEIVTLTDRLPDYTPAEQQEIVAGWRGKRDSKGRETDLTEGELDEARQAVDEQNPDFRHHPAFQAGGRFGNGASAARFGAGWQLHWSLRNGEGNKSWPRVTVVPAVEYVSNGDEFLRVDNRVREVGGSVAGYYEALGWLGVGVSVNGAAHWNSEDRTLREPGGRVGGDVRAHIADGALIGYFGHDWYLGERDGWVGGFMLDPYALFDTFNVRIPWLGIDFGRKPKPPQLDINPTE